MFRMPVLFTLSKPAARLPVQIAWVAAYRGFSSVARRLSSVPEGISAPMRYARIGEILGLFDLHKLRLGCTPQVNN